MSKTIRNLAATLLPLLAAAGCSAPQTSQRAREFELTQDGVLFRDVDVEQGAGELAAIADGDLVVGVLEGVIETHPDGAFFRSDEALSWYEELATAHRGVELRMFPGGIDSLGAEDGASFDSQTIWVCDSADGARKCYTNIDWGSGNICGGNCAILVK
ncbi:MAG: hypothetical protein HYY06_12275 [Deltaproteobacteria bacterium]|nr:hypothetical protein [Deltaproteobacteria bacterium]